MLLNRYPDTMKNTWFRIKNGFLSYSRSDRNAVIILSILIFITLIATIIIRNTESKKYSDTSKIKALFEAWEEMTASTSQTDSVVLFDFDPNTVSQERLELLTIPRNIKQNIIRYRNAGGVFKTPAEMRKIYGMTDSVFHTLEPFIKVKPENKTKLPSALKKEVVTEMVSLHYFDPNTADIEELTELGFSKYQVNNLIGYRTNGGKFNKASDLLKIYGVDSAFYLNIADYIQINETIEIAEISVSDTLMIELNSADSLTLVKLNGVGPSYAKRIIRYRNLLGGYCSNEQIGEIYNFPEETFLKIQNNIYVDTLKITKRRINFAEYSELVSHPYLNKEQVHALLNYRNRKGAFKTIEELRDIEGFDLKTIKRIAPYITCD